MNLLRLDYCPCCGSSKFNIWWENRAYQNITCWRDFFYGGRCFIKDIYSCGSCGYKFINSIEENANKWYLEQDIKVYLKMERYRKEYFAKIKNMLVNQLNIKFDSPALALDIGCGDGQWLRLWDTLLELNGTEASDAFKELLLKNRINVLQDEELKPNKFSLLSMFDFLEHTERPDLYLEQKWSLLKPGGILIIGVPDMGKFAARVLGSKYYLVCPMHYNYFDKISLSKLIKRVCFQGDINMFSSPVLNTDMGGMLKWLGVKWQIPKYFDFSLPLGYSASIIAVVRKKISS